MLKFDDIIELRKLVNDNFGVKLHMHDACGGQYFSLDEENIEVRSFVESYLSLRGLRADFDDNGLSFSVEKL